MVPLQGLKRCGPLVSSGIAKPGKGAFRSRAFPAIHLKLLFPQSKPAFEPSFGPCFVTFWPIQPLGLARSFGLLPSAFGFGLAGVGSLGTDLGLPFNSFSLLLTCFTSTVCSLDRALAGTCRLLFAWKNYAFPPPLRTHTHILLTHVVQLTCPKNTPMSSMLIYGSLHGASILEFQILGVLMTLGVRYPTSRLLTSFVSGLSETNGKCAKKWNASNRGVERQTKGEAEYFGCLGDPRQARQPR